MDRYIFGFDRTDPVGCARKLKDKGIRAVVTDASGAPLAPILSEEGLDVYLCYGAFSLDEDTSEDRHCVDAEGKRRIWFSSGCPNDASLSDMRLQSVLKSINPHIKGIFVDGARFASFASQEGPEAFFTCFCPRCMDEMEKLEFDADAIRANALSLKSGIKPDMRYIRDWLAFRALCVKRYMDAFAHRVHAVDSSLRAGAFIFEPFLAPFTGQTMDACASLDIVAPMLYRNYPHEHGPACMAHEWAALYRIFGEHTPDILSLTGCDSPTLPQRERCADEADHLLKEGFAPSRVGACVKTAKNLMHEGQSLWPIIQIEDASIRDTERYAFESGADYVGYFAYGQAELPDRESQ